MTRPALMPEYLAKIPILTGLNAIEFRQLQEAAELMEFKPGEIIVEQDGTSQDLWILLEGKCEVLRQPKPGEPLHSLATLEPYSNFGEMSFFHAAPHSASVRAQTSVKLLRLVRKAFDELILSHPSVASKLAVNAVASLAERMRRMDDWVIDLLAQIALTKKVPELVRLQEQLFDNWKL